MNRRLVHGCTWGLVLLSAGLLAFADTSLDLPVSPETYQPGPVQPSTEDDPRDEPPPVFYGEEIDSPSETLIYVLDFSDSMMVGDRLDTLRREFKRSVEALPPNFQFNVLLYACATRVWAPAMQTADPGSKASAIGFVEGAWTMGGTGTGPAVAQALAMDRDNLTVILLTDGEPTCGAQGLEAHRAMILNHNVQGAQVFVFGISATGVYRKFCQDVAADSGGSYFDVP